MLKVIIVDDEPRVCRLVKMLADWDALGMEVAGTASNGFEALELVESLRPDILITDMRMPGCDGMELIAKAREISPNLEIALISGYAEFDYAKSAMDFDVGGYLLKPIKKDVLMGILEKLGKKCRERVATIELMENLRQDSHRKHGLLRCRLIEDLLHKRLESPSREKLDSEYSFDAREGLLQVFILKADYNPDKFGGTDLEVLKDKAEEIFGTTILPLCFSGVFYFYGAAGYGVINYGPEKNDEIRRALRHFLNQLEAQKYIFGSIELTLAAGRPVNQCENLPLSVLEAQKAVAERLVEGTGRFFESAPPDSGIDAKKLLDKYSKQIDHAIETLSDEMADGALVELTGGAEEAEGLHGYEFLGLILAAGRIFVMRLNVNDEAGIIQGFEERCGLCCSTGELAGFLRDFHRRQMGVVRELRENEAIRPIRIAKQYIYNHSHEQITLEEVCAATGFSPNYFSTIFKKETGEGFSKYLTRVRIDRAKDLLQNTSLPIAEICVRVGYSDLKHFTSTFKKITDLNPGQYRKLFG